MNEEIKKIIFLDIDGVLNNHVFDRIAGSSTILPVCVGQLNRIIHATGAAVVLSSAWRYMCLDGKEFPAGMTLKGFEYMLRTHGVTQRISIIGHTEPDCDILSAQIVDIKSVGGYWITDMRESAGTWSSTTEISASVFLSIHSFRRLHRKG